MWNHYWFIGEREISSTEIACETCWNIACMCAFTNSYLLLHSLLFCTIYTYISMDALVAKGEIIRVLWAAAVLILCWEGMRVGDLIPIGALGNLPLYKSKHHTAIHNSVLAQNSPIKYNTTNGIRFSPEFLSQKKLSWPFNLTSCTI